MASMKTALRIRAVHHGRSKVALRRDPMPCLGRCPGEGMDPVNGRGSWDMGKLMGFTRLRAAGSSLSWALIFWQPHGARPNAC